MVCACGVCVVWCGVDVVWCGCGVVWWWCGVVRTELIDVRHQLLARARDIQIVVGQFVPNVETGALWCNRSINLTSLVEEAVWHTARVLELHKAEQDHDDVAKDVSWRIAWEAKSAVQEPCLAQYAADLPIAAMQAELLTQTTQHNVVVALGRTGCGKSTQVPKYLLRSGLRSRVLVCQPRRLATTMLW